MPFGQPEWGIFSQTGGAVLEADSVLMMEYAHDYRISDYPQEKGAFQSYNKVQVPWQAKVTFLIATNRQDFLIATETACGSLDLFVVSHPDIEYPSANLIHMGYRRVVREGGASMYAVEVWCEEVRVVGQEQFGNQAGSTAGQVNPGNTQSPNGDPTQNDGAVQPEATAPAAPGFFATIPANVTLHPPT